MRLVANILVLASFKTDYRNPRIGTAGLILQGLGFSFLIAAALRFYRLAADCHHTDAVLPRNTAYDKQPEERRRALPEILLQLANIAAIVLLINGYLYSNVQWSQPSPQNGQQSLSSLIVAGDIIYLVLTIAIAILTTVLVIRARGCASTRIICYVILASLPFLIIRAAYVTYLAATNHAFYDNLAAKIILQYIMEVLAVCILSALGFSSADT